jgi:hypothetical protein
MFRRAFIMFFVLAAATTAVAPNALLACEACRFSPDKKFATCKTLYPTQYGVQSCDVYITDAFNGNTSCYVGPACNPANPYNPFDPLGPGSGGGGGSTFCWADFYFYSMSPSDGPQSAKGSIRGSSNQPSSSRPKSGVVRSLMMAQDPVDCTPLPWY